jgi:hypothetical protein
MSSLRKVLASQANGARSRGPSTPQGKRRSSQNALYHGLFARCVVLDNESRDTFDTLMRQHLDRLKPVDGIEFGMVEEMVSAHWRMRRAWAIETRILQNEIAVQPASQPTPDPADAEINRMASAFKSLAATPAMALMHRYETRLHVMYQRALHNLMLLRAADPNPEVRNEPSPISEHSAPLSILPPAPQQPESTGENL